MHETIFAKSVIKDIKNIDKVKSISLELGELVGISKEELIRGIRNLGYEFKIIIEPVDSYAECFCGYKGRVKVLQRLHDIVIYGCPECEAQPQIIEGNTIKIKKIVYQ